VSKKENDLKDIYHSEKSRGRKTQKTPEALALERLQEEVAHEIEIGRCTRNRFVSILQGYGIDENSDLFREYLRRFDLVKPRVW